MFYDKQKFGIEIEFTGITRAEAAAAAAKSLNGTVQDRSDAYQVIAHDGRIWKFVYDGSLRCQRRASDRGRPVFAGSDYSVELVSPILTYVEDIDTLQHLARILRKAGGLTNKTCGIHIHLDGEPHTPRSLHNFVNLIAARNDLFYKALQIPAERQEYCKKMDEYLVKELNAAKPKSFETIKRIWYSGYSESEHAHYHKSRYHFLNLHCFFNGNRTVELRGFNSTLHAGKIRAYVVFALAINYQALTQKYASPHKCQSENEKFAMRVYLNRIGLIGEEFKHCREHLYKHLDGNAAWRYNNPPARRPRQNGGDHYE